MTAFYSPARRPLDEVERQRAVDASGFLHAGGDPTLARLIREAAELLDTEMAAIAIVDHDRQYFPVELGLGISETPRTVSFSAHAILRPDRPFCVLDAGRDTRFAGNPLVLAPPEIRFYAGVPLIGDDEQPIGALCVLDREPGDVPSNAQFDALMALAARAIMRAPPCAAEDQDAGFSACA